MRMNKKAELMNNGQEDPSPSERADVRIGHMIRRHRTGRGLSLRQVAAHAKVSVGLLSQLERGLASPSLRVLREVCAAIDLPMSRLFEDGDGSGDGVVVRARQRQRLTMSRKGMIKELLSQRQDVSLQGMLVTLDPGGGSGAEPYVHDGEEIGVVLEGTLDLRIGAKDYRLGAGDAFCFESSLPHSFTNPGPSPAKVIWVVSKAFY